MEKLSAVEIYNEGAFVAKTLFYRRRNTTNRYKPASTGRHLFPAVPKRGKIHAEAPLVSQQYQITNADKAVVVVTFTIDEDGNLPMLRYWPLSSGV